MATGHRYTTLITPTHLGSLGYQNFTIFKDQVLGGGAYGRVYKATYDDLPCAAKVLHPTLIDGRTGILVERFVRECEILSKIKHPNIVLYLGLRTDPASRQPVLLMELLDESLTRMLGQPCNPVPYHVQVDISHDISLALAYLHSHNIIHRDLSSNNVLISAKTIAKVTDFGMSCITDHLGSHKLTECPGTKHYMPPEALSDQPTYTKPLDIFSLGVIIVQILTRLLPNPSPKTRILTHCSQLQPHGRYQVVIPEIERRAEHINLIHPPSHPLLAISLQCIRDDPKERPQASELYRKFIDLKQLSMYVESRQSDNDHVNPVRPCVHGTDRGGHQDTTQFKKALQGKSENISTFCQQLSEQEKLLSATFKEIQEKQAALTKCAWEIQHLQGENRNLTALLHQKENQLQQSNRALQAAKKACRLQTEEKKELMKTSNHEIARLRETNRIIIDEKERESHEKYALLSTKEAQIVDLNEKLRDSEQRITDLQRSTFNLHEHQLTSSAQKHQQKQPSPIIIAPVNHETKTSKLDKCGLKETSQVIPKSQSTAPISMYRGAAAVHNGVAYFTCKEKVLSYNVHSQIWTTEPDCPQASGGFTMVGELPTMIGGERAGQVTNEVISLVDGLWTETFPSMPTPRIHSSAVVCQDHLIVAGGSSSVKLGGDVLSVVEVMDINRCQSDQAWSAVSSLLHPLAKASVVVHDEQVVLVGGIDRNGRTLVTQSCEVSMLLNTKKTPPPPKNTKSFGAKFKKAKVDSTPSEWTQLDDSRQFHATCASVGGHLLAIGGCGYSGVGARCVHFYNCQSCLWEEVGLLHTARWLCSAVSLPGNELMVVGGYTTLSSSDTILTDNVEISRLVQ